jgi:hypothetical protein
VLLPAEKAVTELYLKDRIWKKIQGWKEKMLSKAGRIFLLKLVRKKF